MFILHDFLKKHILVLVLQEREVTLDTVELWRIGDVEYRSDLEFLEHLLRKISLVHTKVIEEHSKWLSTKSVGQLLDERLELLGLNALWMNRILNHSILD